MVNMSPQIPPDSGQMGGMLVVLLVPHVEILTNTSIINQLYIYPRCEISQLIHGGAGGCLCDAVSK